MGNRAQHWQATGWLNGDMVTWYGHTLYGLRKAAGQDLYRRQDRLLWFDNMAPGVDSTHAHEHYTYVLLGQDTRRDQRIRDLAKQAGYDVEQPSAPEDPQEQTGWYRFKLETYGHRYRGRSPEYVGSFQDAVQQFTEEMLIPDKGPEYVDLFAEVSSLDEILHRFRTFDKTADVDVLNDRIGRGWYVIGREKVSDGYPVEPTSTVTFVLGHPEEKAR